jgi:hypothetical protein
MAAHNEVLVFQNENMAALQEAVNDWMHDVAVLDIVSVQLLLYPIYTIMILFKHNE